MPCLDKFTTIVDGDQAIVVVDYGHGIVALLALRDLPFSVCIEGLAQSLQTFAFSLQQD